MRLSIVLRYIGVVMLFLALAMFISALFALTRQYDTSVYALLLSSMLTALMGAFPMIFVDKEDHISNKEGYCIVVGSWLLTCVVTTFPYILWGGEFSFTNAWFESVSGLTTTGASILTDIENLPHGLLFWRMLSTWIGGVGVIMFALVILPSMGRSKQTLSNVEMSTIAKDNYRYRTNIIVRIIFVVYVGLTLLTAIMLKVAGMGWFDSLTHAMSAVSTSGFGTKNNSIAFFDSAAIETILCFAMMAGGTHFGLIYATITGKANNIFRSEVMRTYLTFIVIGSLLIGLNLYLTGYYGEILTSMRHAAFQFISLLTTTGFATVDSNPWPSFSIIILICASIVCACAGSTTGGLKTNRILISAKIFKQKIQEQQHPNAIFRVKIDGVTQDASILNSVLMYIVIYMALILLGTLVATLFGLDVISAFTAAIACVGNVGPGFGAVGSMNNYADIPIFVKYFFTFLMLMGRLEIFGLIQLFVLKWWR